MSDLQFATEKFTLAKKYIDVYIPKEQFKNLGLGGQKYSHYEAFYVKHIHLKDLLNLWRFDACPSLHRAPPLKPCTDGIKSYDRFVNSVRRKRLF